MGIAPPSLSRARFVGRLFGSAIITQGTEESDYRTSWPPSLPGHHLSSPYAIILLPTKGGPRLIFCQKEATGTRTPDLMSHSAACYRLQPTARIKTNRMFCFFSIKKVVSQFLIIEMGRHSHRVRTYRAKFRTTSRVLHRQKHPKDHGKKRHVAPNLKLVRDMMSQTLVRPRTRQRRFRRTLAYHHYPKPKP